MRIEALRKQRKLSQAALGELVGVSRASISLYELGHNKPSFEVLVRLADHLQVDLNELMGSATAVHRAENSAPYMVASPAGTYAVSGNTAPVGEYSVPLTGLRYKSYKRVPLGARASFAASYTQDYDFVNLSDFPVVMMPGDPEQGLVMDIDGDSMDPQLRHGMCVLVEEVTPVDGWKLARPGVYVVVFRDHFVVKRIKENTLATTGKVWLSSDNPDGGREEVIIDDIRGMWRVHRIVHAPVR